MTKITDYQNRPIQLGVDKKVSRSGEAVAPVSQLATPSSSPVSITDQARQLASLEQGLQSRPVINEARVAEISSAIQDGRYQINPERIADRLLRLEHELSA